MDSQTDVFRLLVESVRDYAIFLLDPTGHVQTWNAGAERIKGYTRSEIVGKHFSTFYPAADIRRGKPEYELRVAIEDGRYEEEGWRVRRDGSQFWANVVITALIDNDGQVLGFAKVTRDLTERKQAEEERANLLVMERQTRTEAEQALEHLRAIQTVTDAALASLNLDDLLTRLLERIRDVLAVDVVSVLFVDEAGHTLIQQAVTGLIDDAGPLGRIPIGQGLVGRIASDRRGVLVNDVAMAPDAEPMVQQSGLSALIGAPLGVEGRVLGVLLVGTRRHRRFVDADLTFLQIVADRVALAVDRAQLYEQEQAARRAAVKANDAVRQRDEFLSVAAHELKTPITSVRGMSELLLRMTDRGTQIEPARQRRALATIHRQTQHLSRLITQLFEMTRLDADRLTLERRDENLTALVRRCLDEAQAGTDEHRLELVAGPQIHAAVDAFRFEQVVANLLGNAIKYSPDGGQIEVELLQPSPETVRLSVRDHGIGIPPGQEEQIFERYFQAHSGSHRSGLGLGLYLSRQIVWEHSGRLTAETVSGGGSRFTVEIPASPPALEGAVPDA
jgi:PAS domain S-box-containing protein